MVDACTSRTTCHPLWPCSSFSTHGRGGLERWVMGSVTERLLNTTSLPMLVVRPQQLR
ncbi:MAG TPA: hypothetical protein DHW02_08475 [Ktedonobacter sp.]|nr:hypothetical protein [Ktedonobacter sp.]